MRKRFYQKWITGNRLCWFLAVSCLVLFFAYVLFSARGIFYLRKLEKKNKKLQRVNEELLKQNKELNEKIERIKTDRSYREEIARRDLGLVRPNEVIYGFEEKKGKSEGKR
ncbi:MAG: septum formation initiator family protein [Thermodesulfobacteriota bacterium]